MSSFEPPPLGFIGGNHEPPVRETSQTASGDHPHLATCRLRGGGARGPSAPGRPTTRSADHGLSPFGPVLGLKATRWALMLCMWVMACLELVW